MAETSEPNSLKIVILPGLDGMAGLRADFLARLSPEFEAIVIEYPVELAGYEDLFNWVKGMLPVRDYIIVAESFSGPLAIQIAAENPVHLKGLVFVASFAEAPRKLPAAVAGLLRLAPFHLKFFSRVAQPFMMGRWRNAAFTNLFHENSRLVPALTLRGRIREVLSIDCTASLGRISTPYIYLGASYDRPVPRHVADDFRHGAQSVHFVDGPHFLLQAVPDVVAEHVVSFVNSLAQRRSRAL